MYIFFGCMCMGIYIYLALLAGYFQWSTAVCAWLCFIFHSRCIIAHFVTVMFRPGSDSTIRADCPQHCGPTSQGTDLQLQKPDHSLNRLNFQINFWSLFTPVCACAVRMLKKHRECSRQRREFKIGLDVSRKEKKGPLKLHKEYPRGKREKQLKS